MRPQALSQKLGIVLGKEEQHFRLVKMEKAVLKEYRKQRDYEAPYSSPEKMKEVWEKEYEYRPGTLEYYADRFRSYHRLVYIIRTIRYLKDLKNENDSQISS
jgi:hypothetical protein